jgi:hypothetical protein
LIGRSGRAAADQLVALLHPHAVDADKHPGGSPAAVVIHAPDNGGVAVGGQRDRGALRGRSNGAAADELVLLGEPRLRRHDHKRSRDQYRNKAKKRAQRPPAAWAPAKQSKRHDDVPLPSKSLLTLRYIAPAINRNCHCT